MTRPARVWHLISNRWNSAITEYALSAARSLALCGVENLFSPIAASPAEKRAKQLDLDVRTFPGFNLSAVPLGRRIFNEYSPDVIVTYGGPESFLLHFLPKPQM